jgi:hypothetical protein
MRAFVDQINEGIALLLLGDRQLTRIEVPVYCLPKGTGEGTILRLTIKVDARETHEQARVERLRESLGDEP